MPALNGKTKRFLVLCMVSVGILCSALSLRLREQDPASSRQFLNAALTAYGSAGVIASRQDQ